MLPKLYNYRKLIPRNIFFAKLHRQILFSKKKKQEENGKNATENGYLNIYF